MITMNDNNDNDGGSEISFIDAWFANAKSGNQSEVCELLRLKKVPIDSADHLGNTALHYAATAGHASVVESLIKSGANVNSQNKVGDAPLHKAAARGRLECVKLLVNLGKANIDLKNKDDEIPIDLTKDSNIQSELLPVCNDFDDDDSDDDKKDDSDYDSEEEGDDE
ncbi:hypothetical protein PPL_12505 [Heterostelium album PN500]|uniref:Uncharacterized protein n=1 Tax=Heterostelium pallidum (strain ATCC 26659 / Pp 5 / PN500) TaxID=670386 RepID=D3BMT2_HETP5|nr:hypothetical protein PPL_12505 [Heterostelium album PN500]EFA77294.1 hypothetical protein PPL_12505 [Heterostelium album PN500]|eukprot:XP_020429423.1 hypothetical protein PPL_12505 [Heterostelium album PN500]